MNRSLLAALLFSACASSTPSGAACPTSNAPTYGSFGTTFFATYCTPCHSTTAINRHGAPADLDFDSMDDIKRHADGIDLEAAAGPSATNTAMPDIGMTVMEAPSMEERALLGQFLACAKEGKN
jgi:uncharacterized membrane protein